jgi:hypothetical protein
MKTSKLILLVSALSIGSLVGCSSSSDISDRLEDIHETQQDIKQQQSEIAQSEREAEMDVAPDWFLAPPASDGVGFYGVGYARSKNMGHGLKAARLQAEFDLAKMYKQELSGSERAFERGDSQGDVQVQTTFLIDKIIDAVPVVGYSVVEQKMIPVDGVFETFVLLKLPYDEFNKVLQSQRSQTLDKTVQSSFDDLDRRLAVRRAQVSKETEASHRREMESVQQRADIINQANTEQDQGKTPVSTNEPIQLK